MPVNAALGAGETTALNNGASTVLGYLDVVQNTVYATATVASTPTFPTASLSVSGTSANWLTIPRDASVMITDSTATIVRGYYRARLDNSGNVTTANTIYLAEIGAGDPGLLPQDIRVAGIQATDLITVFASWNGWAIQPRIVYSGGINTAQIFEDFNRVLVKENSFPGPATSILVKRASDTGNGKPGAWAWMVDSGQSYATLRFDMVDVEWPTAGVVSYAWTLPGSWTVTGGSITTTTFTAQVPAQAANYFLHCTVSEANGGSTVRHIPIWVRDGVTFTSLPITERMISKDRTSARVMMGLNNNVLASIPDGTLVCYWEVCTWNGSYVPSATRFYNGFVSRENRDMPAPGLRGVSLDIIGPALLLQQMNANSQYLTAVNGTPSDWQSLSKTLSYIDFVIYWIMSRRTSLLYVFDYVPLGSLALNWQINAWDIPTGNVLQQCQNQAARVTANFGSDSAGQFVVARHPSSSTYATRGANVVTRDSWNASLYTRAAVVREVRPRIRRTRGEAFYWGGTVGVLPSPMLCDAPDTVPGQGVAEDVLPAQIVSGQIELNERTGMWWAMKNNPYTVTVTIPGNRDVIEPAHMQFVSLTVPAYLSPDGIGYTKNIVPTQVSKRYTNEGGYADVECQAEFETAGLPGKYVQVPLANGQMFGSYSALPVTLSLPVQAANRWGNLSSTVPVSLLVLLNNATSNRVYRRTAVGTWSDISPTLTQQNAAGGTPIRMITNPWAFNQLVILFNGGVLYSSDYTQPTVTWTVAAIAPPVNYTFTDMIVGSINRQNYFAWPMRLITFALPDQSFYCYTTDLFATFSSVVAGSFPGSTNPINLQVGCFNNGATGWCWYMPSRRTLAYSTNWGATWTNSPISGSDPTVGGGINMPYSLYGGGNNSNNDNLAVYAVAPTMKIVNATGSSVHKSVALANADMITSYGMNSFTLDGSYLAAVGDQTAHVNLSSDGGSTWTVNAGPPGRSGSLGTWVNGFPTNPNYLLVGGPWWFGYTADRGVTWTDLWNEMITATGAGPTGVLTAFADLTLFYPTGGVHP